MRVMMLQPNNIDIDQIRIVIRNVHELGSMDQHLGALEQEDREEMESASIANYIPIDPRRPPDMRWKNFGSQ